MFSPSAASSAVSLDELAELEDSISEIQRKPSADEFARIMGELSTNRRMANASRTSLNHRRSHQSFASSDDGRSLSRLSNVDDDASVTSSHRIACCCGQAACDSSKRFMQQMRELESDLQLSAEIGQALLRRQDTIVNKAQQESDDHAQQRDQILARLTQSIKENQALERQLTQSNFNLEAADQSHHALLTELEEVRQQVRQLKQHRLKAVNLETKLDYAMSELEDVRHELDTERQRARAAEGRSQQVLVKRCTELTDILEHETRRLTDRDMRSYEGMYERVILQAPDEQKDLRTLVDDHAALRDENAKLRAMVKGANTEVSRLHKIVSARTEHELLPEAQMHRNPPAPLELPSDDASESTVAATESKFLTARSSMTVASNEAARVASGSSRSEPYSEKSRDGTSVTTASVHSRHDDKLSNDAHSMHTFGSDRDYETHGATDTRTALLSTMLEFVQRTYAKLQQADVDTLSARLHRQKLAGDVSHLARTTVQASVRDIEGIREHFRRQLEREARTLDRAARDTPDASLVTRRDFFAMLKFLREVLLELAKLRRAVNDVHINPGNASRILHEQLDASMDYAPKGSWIARMLSGALSSAEAPAPPPSPSPAPSTPAAESTFSRLLGTTASPPASPAPMPRRRHGAVPIHMTPRASAAKPTSVAVQACGSQATVAGSHFPGARGFVPRSSALARGASRDRPEFTRSMRVMDDDQVSLRYGEVFDPTRSIRPRARGMSDSSIHSTFLEHGERDAPLDRVITAATLTLEPGL
ncbi:uncharacterized protein MJAP1_001720 [Malassezia japonica]|uniref:Uncharacterized protein n=1 Tax=Malassezia japonica TaxID=223818 RepID=A0AAF0F2S3_9BASI|nr:uncharacterized protein MJAP1_001720 [Malassezia japonica]WFD38756.1 hypothetical protein MJAP1_001720 [Malassezia japonica]